MANSTIRKRIKITRNGKLVRRKSAQGHFRANKSGAQIQKKRNISSIASTDAKRIINYLSR